VNKDSEAWFYSASTEASAGQVFAHADAFGQQKSPAMRSGAKIVIAQALFGYAHGA
jgi:hypothetical protein